MSDGTVTKAIQHLGFGDKLVAHGFRALTRTTIRERIKDKNGRKKYDSEVIERQLAHISSEALRDTYDRSQFLEERVEMMQDWADFIDNLCNTLHVRT